MKIINSSNNIVIAANVVIADSIFSRVKGLLGKKSLLDGSAIILKPCNSIHTFFMQFPIDVVFIGRDGRTVKLIHSLKPNRMTPVYWQAQYTIEFPAGTLRKSSTTISDRLEIIQ